VCVANRELSLLPLAGGWRSLRTITAVQNAMLYYIAKAKIEWLASRFPDLKHKLHDHAEDYEKILSLGSKGHGYKHVPSFVHAALAILAPRPYLSICLRMHMIDAFRRAVFGFQRGHWRVHQPYLSR
jgi:CTP synthase (UTP-ammonia lyase)